MASQVDSNSISNLKLILAPHCHIITKVKIRVVNMNQDVSILKCNEYSRNPAILGKKIYIIKLEVSGQSSQAVIMYNKVYSQNLYAHIILLLCRRSFMMYPYKTTSHDR